MNAVHPGPNAGNGKEIYQSYYIRKSDKLDQIIYCAQCGWNMDLQKRGTGDSLGAIPSGSAIQKTSTFTPPRGASQVDQYADPVDTNSGCPLCNTLNPRAVGRGITGFERPKKSVENL
jgi:hypothetical protein